MIHTDSASSIKLAWFVIVGCMTRVGLRLNMHTTLIASIMYAPEICHWNEVATSLLTSADINFSPNLGILKSIFTYLS